MVNGAARYEKPPLSTPIGTVLVYPQGGDGQMQLSQTRPVMRWDERESRPCPMPTVINLVMFREEANDSSVY